MALSAERTELCTEDMGGATTLEDSFLEAIQALGVNTLEKVLEGSGLEVLVTWLRKEEMVGVTTLEDSTMEGIQTLRVETLEVLQGSGLEVLVT